MTHFALGIVDKPSGGGGGFPIFYEWDPENGEALPGTSTFTRSTSAWYRDDSGIWQVAVPGEERGSHNFIPGGGGKGFIDEPETTKLALFPRDLTNGAWSATNITTAKDATGIDGVASAASTLTATAANGTIFQTFTSAAGDRTFTCFVARKTGTGTIEITIDGGSTFTDITSSLTSSIDNPFVVRQTLANPSIGFRIVTSGDAIEVDMADIEALNYPTTPLDHTSGTITRTDDNLTDLTLPSEYSTVFDMTFPNFSDNALGRPGWFRDDTTGLQALLSNGTTIPRIAGGGFDAFFVATSFLGERHKIAFSVKDNEAIIIDDDGNSATDLSGTLNPGTLILGRAGSLYHRGVIHKMTVYSQFLTQSELEALVA